MIKVVSTQKRLYGYIFMVSNVFISLQAHIPAQLYKEARTSFFYNNLPIHPSVIKKFIPSLSDNWKPKVVSVDIAAAFGSNEFYDTFEWKVVNKIVSCCISDQDGSNFAYHWLGKLDNGLHVIKTVEYIRNCFYSGR